MSRCRVVIADDHSSMRQRVAEILSSEFDVVAAVGNGLSAVDAVLAHEPDLVVLDISMPVMNGLDAAARLAEGPHVPGIIFLTVHEDPEFVEAARRVGARGYVLKRTIATDLLPTVRAVRDELAPASARLDITTHTNERL